ncbi:MAG TPA: flavodoxin family protein [Anaerolineae bacterium]|nr:flavodoxin family protein [Anaerolineae bacterium]
MKTLVVYDSVHGNTEKIAQAIGEAVGGDVEVLHAGVVDPAELKTVDLLFVGAPTHGGRASPAMQGFLKEVQGSSLAGTSVATFDTRLTARWVRIFGYAAGRIGSTLKKKGGTLIASPEGFFVKGTEGPLKEGEVERAAQWAEEIVKSKE